MRLVSPKGIAGEPASHGRTHGKVNDALLSFVGQSVAQRPRSIAVLRHGRVSFRHAAVDAFGFAGFRFAEEQRNGGTA